MAQLLRRAVLPTHRQVGRRALMLDVQTRGLDEATAAAQTPMQIHHHAQRLKRWGQVAV